MRFLITSLSLFIVSYTFAQTKLLVLDTTNSGIPSNSITAIKFDINKNLWVGTSDAGLGFFNGSNWTYFNVANTPSFSSNHISDIQQHPNGDMWFGTCDRGIMKKSGGSWTSFDTSIIKSNSAVCRFNQTYIQFDKSGNTYTKSRYLYKYDGINWRVIDSLTQATNLKKGNMLAFDKDDNIWTNSNYRYENNNWVKKINLTHGTDQDIASGVTIDTNQNVFLIVQGISDSLFLLKYDGSTASYFYILNHLTNKALIKTNPYNNEVWFSYLFYLYKFNGSNIDLIKLGDELLPTPYRRRSIEFDSKGNTWVGLNKSEESYKQEIDFGGIVIYNENGVNLSGFPVGITHKIDRKLSLSVYPNPIDDLITVDINNTNIVSSVRITSMNGILMLEQNISSSSTKLNVDKFLPGIYILELLDSNGNVLQNEKIYKQ